MFPQDLESKNEDGRYSFKLLALQYSFLLAGLHKCTGRCIVLLLELAFVALAVAVAVLAKY